MSKENHPENNGYVGIKDIAKPTGVSTTAVSRVVNDPEVASERVRKKVQKVTEEYGYVPNQPVKKILPETSDTTAVLMYNMENPFFTGLIKELNQICLEHNYMLPICDTGSNPELEEKCLYFYLANRCAGIILTEGVDSDIFEACGVHIPIAFLDRETHGKFLGICSDNRQMVQPIVDYLYNLGRRRIAFVGCRTPMDSVISRRNGYIGTMTGKRLPIIREYICNRNPQLTLQAGSQALSYFLFLPTTPTTIICYNDITALGVLNAVCSLGLKIPAGMSIVGFDNVIGNFRQPQITTVQQSLRDVSLELFELVINPPEGPVSKIVEASFIEGTICSRIRTPQK